MRNSSITDQLQPSLLDRLTDQAPEQREESSRDRVLSAAQLRAAVVRDLDWLLNTNQYANSSDLSDCPELLSSTLNYGVPDLSGHVLDSVDPKELAALLREAIVRFEPRIDARTLVITGEDSVDQGGGRTLSFGIDGDVFSQRGSQHLLLKTVVDLDTGSVTISGGGS